MSFELIPFSFLLARGLLDQTGGCYRTGHAKKKQYQRQVLPQKARIRLQERNSPVFVLPLMEKQGHPDQNNSCNSLYFMLLGNHQPWLGRLAGTVKPGGSLRVST